MAGLIRPAGGYAVGVTASDASVCVFAPSPLLTVTIEKGSANPEVHVHAGGQGAWIANMLAVLETRTILCAPLGGEIGLVLAAVLDRERLEVRSVPTESSNGCYVEDRRSGDLECLAEMSAARLNRHESDELCNTLLTAGLETGVAVLTGRAGQPVVEPALYRRVAADLCKLGVTVVADLSGAELEAALDGGIDVLKVSDEELDGENPVRAAERLRHRVSNAVVVTRGTDPALLLGEELSAVHVPSLETVNHRGAGDSMTAGIAAGLARGYALGEAMRLGAASGAVNATRHGLASGRRDTIEKLAEQVSIQPATKEEAERARTHHQ